MYCHVHITLFKLFNLFAYTSMLVHLSSASYPGQTGILFLRDRLPQSDNFVILTLNGVDRIKVPIPIGASAGHVSLLDFGEPVVDPDAKPPSLLRQSWTWVREAIEEANNVNGPISHYQGGKRLYSLQQAQVTARSGPYKPRCIFTKPDPFYGKRRFNDWVQSYLDETSARESIRKHVSDVWCVAEQENIAKIIVDPPPPPPPPLPSRSPQASGTSSLPSGDVVRIIELQLQTARPSGRMYALTKLGSEDGDLVRIERAVLFSQPVTRGSPVICRPILYDGWPGRPLYQGPPILDTITSYYDEGAEPGAYVFAIYCDNWLDRENYMSVLYRTSWNPNWTSAVEAILEYGDRIADEQTDSYFTSSPDDQETE